jgi:hypothetical protein
MKPEPREEIAAYVAEVSQPGVPWISNSHHTLFQLGSKYGRSRVEMWLNEHWAAVRAWNEANKPV